MGRLTSTSSGGRLATNKSTNLTNLESLAEYAKSQGLEKEAEKALKQPKLSLLQRLGRGLTAFETGSALYQKQYEGKSFLKTYGQDIVTGLGEAITGREKRVTPKYVFKDILVKEGMKDRPGKLDPVDVLGLVGDILTDPTTFFGGTVAKKVVKPTLKLTAKTAKKVPILGRGIEAVEQTTKELFQPFSKIKALEKGDDYVQAFQRFARGTRSDIDDFVSSVALKAKGLKETTKIKDVGAKIGLAVETGTKTGNKLIDEVMDSLIKTQNHFTEKEVSRGILEAQLPDYMHHMLTPEAADFMSLRGDVTNFIKSIRVKLGAAKGRKLEGTVAEINKLFKKQHGFNLFEEDAFKAFAKRGVDSIKAVNTYDFLARVGNQFGKKAEKDFIDDVGVKWVETGAKELKGIRVPEPIARHIDEMKKFMTNDEATNKFLNLYDKTLALWKGSVTGYFPAFHTRNFTSGLFNNWLAGLYDPTMYKVANDILKGKTGKLTLKSGAKMSYQQVNQLLKQYGVVGQTGYLDVAKFLEKEVSPTIGSRILKAPQQVMGLIENNLRAPLFIHGLKKGLSPADAAKQVIKYHFDYMPEGFTAFERNIMKRVIPFYTWTRNNIPLQLEQLVMQPGKYAGVFKTQRAAGMQPSSEDERYLPKWLKERFTIKNEGGYWSGLGTPLEEATEKLSQPLRGFGISMSPFIKIPIEQLTGYNIFKDRKIDEDIYAKYYENIPKPIKEWLDFREYTSKDGRKYYTVNPRKKYWLETIGARGLNTALRVASGVSDPASKEELLILITLIKKYEYDIDTLKSWSDTEQRQQLEKALIEAGKLREYNVKYIPKENK